MGRVKVPGGKGGGGYDIEKIYPLADINLDNRFYASFDVSHLGTSFAIAGVVLLHEVRAGPDAQVSSISFCYATPGYYGDTFVRKGCARQDDFMGGYTDQDFGISLSAAGILSVSCSCSWRGRTVAPLDIYITRVKV